MAKNKRKSAGKPQDEAEEVIRPHHEDDAEQAGADEEQSDVSGVATDDEDETPVETFAPDANEGDVADGEDRGPQAKSVAADTGGGKFQRFKQWFGRHKRLAIPSTIVLLVAVLAAIPFTRYALAGAVLKQTFAVRVVDAETNKPVSSADVTLAGKKVQTDGEGRAQLKVRVGSAKLTVEKKYYEKAEKSVVVPIVKQKQPVEMKLKATGRQVAITVVNTITKKPVENATVASLDTKASTDKDGKAVLVLPADKGYVDATITADTYNELKHPLAANADEGVNVISLTPAGSVYFLSDRSGTLDVVKTKLDGSDRTVVLAGTGKEDKPSTVLLASRDWKYLALLSKRDGGEFAKLFLIDTSTDKMTVMDEGRATFSATGWSDHRFVYTVNRSDVALWEANRQALKSYDAEAKKIATLDQVGGVGDSILYSYETISSAYILKNEIVYTRQWQAVVGSYNYSYQTYLQWKEGVHARKAEVHAIRADGSSGRTVKGYAVGVPNVSAAGPGLPTVVHIEARVYEPQSLWLLVDSTGPNELLEEYEDGQIKSVSGHSANDFWQTAYSTYLVSPGGEKTFWSDVRDGKNTLLVGDDKGKNGAEVAKLSDYDTYGWYTDQYLLVSKKGSELYIMPVAGGEALKLTDYYKPKVSFEGYGYGYGGL